MLQKKEKSLIKDTFSSIVAGMTVSYTTFPLEGLKKHLASGISHQDFKLWRGSLVFALNIVPTTTIQLMTDRFLKRFVNENSSTPLRLLQSAYCGFQGAFFATFVENCIARQQVLKSGLSFAIKDMFQQGYLRPWKSFPLIATRDSIFTLFMLLINPEVKQYCAAVYPGNTYASYLMTFMVGFIGAFLSHPFDTMGTRMQRTHEFMSFRSAANDVMINLGGYKGFYKGFLCRVCLFTAFSNTIPYVKEWVDERLEIAYF